MITLYSGTPGSGKSFHVIDIIAFKLKHSGNVIANFPIKVQNIKGVQGIFEYKDNKELNVPYLMQFARTHHTKGKEAQTLIVIDEAQALFNPREYTRPDRKDFNQFFSLHRHLGYNVILITQNDRLLDRQIRCLLEYEIKHRKVNNFKMIGKLIPFKTFAAVTYWYGVRERIGVDFIIFRKKLAELYDSYVLFDVLEQGKVESHEGSGVGGSPVHQRIEFTCTEKKLIETEKSE